MCGIAGYISKTPVNSHRIKATIEALSKRGPDANGVKFLKSRNQHVGLVHTRLSIIDLDERANQPFTFEYLTMVFNGEIYNYKEIRKKLQHIGYSFHTTSDTEVLIKGWHAKGTEILKELEGMWSLVIHDSKNQMTFLTRDRFGEKPFYTYQKNNDLFFGSEIKVIPLLSGESLKINEKQVYRYLINTHKSLNKYNETFYQNISQIAPGELWSINQNFNCKKESFWKPSYNPQIISEEEAVVEIRKRLIQSVKIRLRSDVPLAFCLSGGVDSASLVSIATKELGHKVQTFSIVDQDERYNEKENIQATIDDTGCKSELIHLNPDFDYLSHLSKLIEYHSEPIGTISYLVHSRLIESMSNHGYKISISGTGADELFTGYYDHFLYHIAGLSGQKQDEQIQYWKDFPAKFVRNPLLQDPKRFQTQPNNREHIYLNNNDFRTFLNNDFNEAFEEKIFTPDLLRNRMLNELFHEVIPVILHEDDLNSMFHSIENRSPFLDSKLFELAYSIPSSLLIDKGYNKYLLRQSMKGILNEKVRLSREKKGFNASINSIIDFDNPNDVNFILEDSPIFQFVKKEKIANLLKQKELPNSYKKFFFNFLNVKIWLDE